MLKKIVKYLFFFALLLLLGVLYSFSNKRNSNKVVSSMPVVFQGENNNFLTQEMVNKLLIQNNDQLKNQAKSVIDLHKLEKTVLSNPFVEKASVSVSIDGELKSIIKQRKPIARIVTFDKQYYIDLQGVKVPVSKNYSARVPLVTGVKKDKDLKQVYQLMQVINSDEFLKKEVVGIQKTEFDEYIFAVRSGNYKIEYGKLINNSDKVKKLKAFYSKTFSDGTIKKYKNINLKYKNQVVAVK